jgi:Uma2 family endonuclease
VTAQPISGGPVYAGPSPARQRLADYTVADVLALPEDAPRVELRDGVMIAVPSPTFEHQNICNQLWQWLHARAPKGFAVTTALGVAVTDADTLEPDVVLLRARPPQNSHYVSPDLVTLAVEVVSRGTKRRDRFEKPADYAAAGVPHYWRIEQHPVHVFAYELGDDGIYRLVADSTTELLLERPFEIKLSIADITP